LAARIEEGPGKIAVEREIMSDFSFKIPTGRKRWRAIAYFRSLDGRDPVMVSSENLFLG
jgi:hypothetical protein